MKNSYSVTCIGLGPRGVTIIERLLAVLKERKDGIKPVINIIDEGVSGCGVHFTDQPQSLLVNTIASQITMYTDKSVIGAGPISSGPCFYSWANEQGYKFDETTLQYTQSTGRKLLPNDYLPRSIFGKYLNWVVVNIIKELREYCSVNIYKNSAVNINKLNDNEYSITLNNGLILKSNYLFLTTGHSTNQLTAREKNLTLQTAELRSINKHFAYIPNPYPIAKIAAQFNHEMTVAIEGFGLTANDILSEATVGKGGRYVRSEQPGHFRYIKSGHEPKIIIYSTRGLPFGGRAINQKGVSTQYKPIFFTHQKTALLREQFGSGPQKQLDFEKNVLPELIKEMQYCYYMTILKNEKNSDRSFVFSKEFITHANHPNNLENLINLYFPKNIQFNWDEIVDPTLGQVFESPATYKKWLINYLENDLNECLKGNVDSPYNASFDVLRDVRDILRSVVDFSGLTEESHKLFIQKYVPVMNRISVGPPKERIAELIALIESNNVDIFVGNNPTITVDVHRAKFKIAGSNITNNIVREADQIVQARIASSLPKFDESLLMKNMLKNGLVKEFYNGNFHPGGIDIDKNFHPINRDGGIELSTWAIGTIVEGPKYYTFIVPRFGVNSTGLLDAGKVILELFDRIEQKERNSNYISNTMPFFRQKPTANVPLVNISLLFLALTIEVRMKSDINNLKEYNNENNKKITV